MYVILISTLK